MEAKHFKRKASTCQPDKVTALNHVEALKQLAFEEGNFDCFLVFSPMNLLYLIGVPGMSCLLIPKKGKSMLYVYGVNYEQGRAEAKDCDVELVKRGEDLMQRLAGQVKTFRFKKLALDGLGAEAYRSLAKHLRGKTNIEIEGNLVWELRKVKQVDELELMKKAADLTSAGMKAAYETIRPGVTEIQVAAQIEYAMRSQGGWGTAFETSVASGARSAYPHGGCTERKIPPCDLVIIDIGAVYHHYCSDMTRTVVAGKPNTKQEKLYEIVNQAQTKSYEAMKANAKAADVDSAARKVITAAGYGDKFPHGLGHGVGLEVHEPPSLAPTSKDKLALGNVITNEPGIYIVDYGGIRIEDSVLIAKRGAERLTRGPYTLQTGK